jgi:hypothetical protein
MDKLMLDIKCKFIDLIKSYPNRIGIIILIITNFICNNLFLFNLKYYSDDWSSLVYPIPVRDITFFKALLHSQRPIYITLISFGQQIASNVVLFHLLAFITTTIALIIIYYIFRIIYLSQFSFILLNLP